MLREVQLLAPWTALALPWQSIEIYRSEDTSIQESIDVLRTGVSLTHCSLYLKVASPEPTLLLPSMPRLQSLTLFERADNRTMPLLVMSLLRSLTLPALRNLNLKFEDPRSRPPEDVSEFLSFVARSSLQLEELTLCLMPVSERDLLRCLECLQSLVTVRLQIAASMDALLERLYSDAGFLPRLQSLHIANFTPSDTPWEYTSPSSNATLEMLFSRWRRSLLQDFHFHYVGTDEMVVFTAMVTTHPTWETLRKVGMTLVLEEFHQEPQAGDWWVYTVY
ncbi:hypothetical protein FB45DRAFT_1061383 [Roridomyces roridus]|uniref:Uncharacterized protein n=1 Tax=Roridomyces roridus TaxID=1738132 RepID=A0AAD7FK19_9AGAR|nr:hypothetical protein FB45DRAFT_1061383 [Roridomyces roridus]